MLILYRFIRYFISAIMLLSPLAKPVITPPQTTVTQQTENQFMSTYGNTQISAHRLGKGNAPENTVMAVNECFKSDDYQIDFFEMDVQLTKDKQVVVYHGLSLDEVSNSAEYFGKEGTTVFSKTYDELRNLNMGENFKYNGKYPYRGLRGDDIPEDLRIAKLEDIIDCIETHAPGKYKYTIEIKYPHPWAPEIISQVYTILSERDMIDRVIVASFWPDVHNHLRVFYKDKLNRSADPFEMVGLYDSFLNNDDLSRVDLGYCALQVPYYHDTVLDDRQVLLIGNFGKPEFIEYCHKYNIAVQYWTVDTPQDIEELRLAGADAIMTDHPDRAYNIYKEFWTQIEPASQIPSK